MDSIYIILTLTLISASCGILGCFLILRRMAMVGDAISHAVLPGIVIAYLISGNKDPFWMILGAGALGIFTTFLIEFLHKKVRLQTDAAIGVTFTWLFALGIILISLYAGKVDLDQDCVLYGEIAYVPLDLIISDSNLVYGPRALYISLVVLVINVAFIVFGFRSLYMTTFDAPFAAVMGISVTLWHYLLMGAVSMTTVASFESVGAILVVALLVVPPATAYLLTHKLEEMIWITVGISFVISSLGYGLAVLIDGSIAGAVVTVSGVLFGLAFLFSPSHGYLTSRNKKKADLAAVSVTN